MKVIELFAGIGSQRKALTNLQVKHEVLNVAEWYIPAILAYDSIHNGKRTKKELNKVSLDEIKSYLSKFTFSGNSKTPISKQNLFNLGETTLRHLYLSNQRINNLVSIDKISYAELPKNIDLLTYSFPCQDLSNVGAFHGYTNGIDRDKKSRSGLLWEVERLLLDLDKHSRNLPKILLMENVSTLLSKRHKDNFNEWKAVLKDLGYINKVYVRNSLDHGIPQNRERVFMVSVLTRGLDSDVLKRINDILDSDFERKERRDLNEFLRVSKTSKYLNEAQLAQPNDTPSRREIFDKNYYLYGTQKECKEFCPTITTRQDRHPNSGVIEFKTEINKYRYLTSREVFLLMGFSEKDYEAIERDNFMRNKSSMYFTRDKYYILAGNSIVVDVLMDIFKKIYEIYNLV